MPPPSGRLVEELIRSPQVQEAVEATLRLINPTPYQGELSFPSRDGPVRSPGRSLSVRGTPLPGDPSPGAVLVFHDVTELRRLERMRQDFVANASHELKTPLASIKAYTETLLDWALHDETVNVRFLERIDEQAERLNRLILDLLSLARLESGQEIFDHQPLSIIPVLESCVEAHRGRAEAKNLVLTFDPGDLDDESLILADEEALRQIADNLIDNAIKYTPENGSVRVSCRTQKDAIAVEVTDTGIGIPRDDLPRIFERFYRVDKARSRELGGTGLGLSIVKHLVQSIGGQLEVTSRLGSGSQVHRVVPPRPALRPESGGRTSQRGRWTWPGSAVRVGVISALMMRASVGGPGSRSRHSIYRKRRSLADDRAGLGAIASGIPLQSRLRDVRKDRTISTEDRFPRDERPSA